MKRIKSSAWAKQQGIAYRTAWNWYKAGRGAGTRASDAHGDYVTQCQNDPQPDP